MSGWTVRRTLCIAGDCVPQTRCIHFVPCILVCISIFVSAKMAQIGKTHSPTDALNISNTYPKSMSHSCCKHGPKYCPITIKAWSHLIHGPNVFRTPHATPYIIPLSIPYGIPSDIPCGIPYCTLHGVRYDVSSLLRIVCHVVYQMQLHHMVYHIAYRKDTVRGRCKVAGRHLAQSHISPMFAGGS